MPTRPSIGRPDETYGTKTRLTTISIRPSKVCHTTAATSRANMDIIVPDFFQKFCNRKSGITLFEFLIPLQFEDDFSDSSFWYGYSENHSSGFSENLMVTHA